MPPKQYWLISDEGITDRTDPSGIMVYPNPTTGLITIGFDNDPGAVEVMVMNTLNKVLFTESRNTLSGTELKFDLSNLAKGIYVLKLKTDKMEKITKIILQ